MKNLKEKGVAFTGYRLAKILRSGTPPELLNEIAKRTYEAIKSLADDGYTHFYSGMSDGYDLIAAEQVLRLKATNPEVQLIAVIPFKGQELRYSDADKAMYHSVLKSADKAVILAENNTDNSQFLQRNDYLLAHSTALVCYYDGKRGGTMYTYNRAVKTKMSITNICKYR